MENVKLEFLLARPNNCKIFKGLYNNHRPQSYQWSWPLKHLENQAKAIDAIQKRINEYLKEYNKEGKYNFIFSTQEGNPTLYFKDTAFNITSEVVKGLNDTYKQSKKQ